VPGNDDAIRSIRLFTKMVSDTVLESRAFVQEGNDQATVSFGGDANETEGQTTTPASRLIPHPRHDSARPRPGAGGVPTQEEPNVVTADMVKELRERTGAGMMECKKALVESNGNFDLAVEALRKSGIARADKRSERAASEGLSRRTSIPATGWAC